MSKKPTYLNVVNYYNSKHKEEMITILMNDKRVQSLGRGKYGVHLNKGDKNVDFIESQRGLKVMNDVTIKFGKSIVELKEGMFLMPFDLLVAGKYKGNTSLAIHSLNHRFLKKDPPYIRVGMDFFKKTIETDRDGIDRIILKKWNKETLLLDYNTDFLQMIPKYDSFGIFPDNKNYQEVVNGQYNQYAPFSHTASKTYKVKDIKWSLNLIKHVWGDQWKLGLTYLQVLYLWPKQILPILALVSAERETGKSTFGDWMNILFGDNACVVGPREISSNHNSSYGTKNIILIEETKIEKSVDLEKIKTIATQKKITMNPKFVTEYQIPFYAKVIMFSNHEDKFVKIDEEENRYWVLKMPSLKGKANHNILEDLTKEVPKFLAYLDKLKKPDFTRSRMVFTQEEISTQILEQTKLNSRSGAMKDINIYLNLEMLENPGREYIYFRHEGLHQKYFARGSSYSISYISEVLKNEMKLKMEHRTYEKLIGDTSTKHRQIRAYKIPNEHYDEALKEVDDEGIF